MESYFSQEKDRIFADYFTLLSFPSIGTDPQHLRDCVQCALWLRTWLKPLGFSGELIQPADDPSAPPVLFAERPGRADAPAILFYGHYDVQPPDPLALWQTPPFSPVLKADNRVYARGAQDDKGQFFSFLCGLKARIEAGGAALPTIKILLEGQEESGSHALTRLLTRAALPSSGPDFPGRLDAQILCVCDTSAAADLRPAIVAGLRGVSHFTLRLTAASHDLHSGVYGGVAPNPAQGIAAVLAALHHADGSIAVPGFCEDVLPPSPEERAAAEASQLSAEAYREQIGCPAEGGERALAPVIRNAFRPTIEVNGIHTGYGGPGSKTVIPAEAYAKLSMRLVPNQSPERVLEAVAAYLKRHTPPGMTLTLEDVTGGAPGFRLPLASPIFRLAADILTEMDPRGPAYVWEGASIPVVSLLREVSGAAPLLVGWGQSGDCIHAPNESYGCDQFVRAMTWASKLVSAFL